MGSHSKTPPLRENGLLREEPNQPACDTALHSVCAGNQSVAGKAMIHRATEESLFWEAMRSAGPGLVSPLLWHNTREAALGYLQVISLRRGDSKPLLHRLTAVAPAWPLDIARARTDVNRRRQHAVAGIEVQKVHCSLCIATSRNSNSMVYPVRPTTLGDSASGIWRA
jgi:hypothetical protein